MLVTEPWLTLCNPMVCSPPGSSVHEILQARILDLVVIFFSRGSSRSRDWTQVSCTGGRFFSIWATRDSLQTTILMHGYDFQSSVSLAPSLGSLQSPSYPMDNKVLGNPPCFLRQCKSHQVLPCLSLSGPLQSEEISPSLNFYGT